MPDPQADATRLTQIDARLAALQRHLDDWSQAHYGDPNAQSAYDYDTKAWRDEIETLRTTRDGILLDQALGGVDVSDLKQVNDRIEQLRLDEYGDMTHAPVKLDYYRKRAATAALAKLTAARDGLVGVPSPVSSVPLAPTALPDVSALPELKFDDPEGATPDPSADTGHYDDGHAFGWKPPEASTPPPATDSSDTGHYDDGHAFGWKPPEPEVAPAEDPPMPEIAPDHGMFIDGMAALASPPTPTGKTAKKAPVPLIAGGAAVVLLLGAVGLGLGRSAGTPAVTAAPTAVKASTQAVAAAPATPKPAVACTLVTAAEATTILGTPTTTDVGGAELCNYTPSPPGADFAVKETGPRGEDLTQDIRIAKVVIRSATGAQAATSYNDSFALFDATRGDEMVPGIGDKAFYSRGGLYVLQGAKFLAITTTSQQSAAFGSPVYPPMHAKFVSILQAFATIALPRLN